MGLDSPDAGTGRRPRGGRSPFNGLHTPGSHGLAGTSAGVVAWRCSCFRHSAVWPSSTSSPFHRSRPEWKSARKLHRMPWASSASPFSRRTWLELSSARGLRRLSLFWPFSRFRSYRPWPPWRFAQAPPNSASGQAQSHGAQEATTWHMTVICLVASVLSSRHWGRCRVELTSKQLLRGSRAT